MPRETPARAIAAEARPVGVGREPRKGTILVPKVLEVRVREGCPESRSRNTVRTCIKRSASGYGNGRKKIPFTTLKIAVVAPMPSASVTTAMTA